MPDDSNYRPFRDPAYFGDDRIAADGPPNDANRPLAEAPQLSKAQIQAAHYMALGYSYTEMASMLGVGRCTLYRWRKEPTFAAYLNQLAHQAADYATFQLHSLLKEALKVIAEQLKSSSNPASQLKSAFKVVSLATRPSMLRHLQSLPDDPLDIASLQIRDRHIAQGQPIHWFGDGDYKELQERHACLTWRAEKFDAAHPELMKAIDAVVPQVFAQPPATPDETK